jgi:hypothetical protein
VHTYTQAGQYVVRLTVSDGVSSSQSTPLTITVGNPPTATINSPTDGLVFRAGDVINYSGDATDQEDGTLPASAYRGCRTKPSRKGRCTLAEVHARTAVRHDVTTNPLRVTDEVAALRAHPYKRSSELAGGLCDNLYTWNIDFLHDNHVHPGTAITGVKSGSFTIPTSGHDFAGNTRYRIKLTVTDSNGLQTSKSVTIWPDKMNLSFDTSPSGLNLHVDGISRRTPFVLDTLVSFNHTIEARDQTSGNKTTPSARGRTAVLGATPSRCRARRTRIRRPTR